MESVNQQFYIVSMYNKQRDLIAKLVEGSGMGARLRAASDCQVLSVDACQGDEADAVIVSTVKTTPIISKFWRDRQRINVAMSRARHLAIVVGHRPTLQLPKARPWPSVLVDYAGMNDGSSTSSDSSTSGAGVASSTSNASKRHDDKALRQRLAQAPACAGNVLRVTRSMLVKSARRKSGSKA